MSDGIDTLPPLRTVIKDAGLSANKALGQNYILDLNLTRKIARAVPNLSDMHVIEIGPGPGGLTRGLLLEGAKHVTAIEMDERFLGPLEDLNTASGGRLTVHHGDALKYDWAGVKGPVAICANLPYNVGTALLVKWLNADWPPFFTSLTLMFQREVAERVVATVGDKQYGRLAILANWRAETRKLFDVPAAAFTPPPKVTSSIVQVTPTEPMMDGIDVAGLGRLTERVFSQRRKMLRASLKGTFEDPVAVLSALDISPTARPEELGIEDFLKMQRVIQAQEAATSTEQGLDILETIARVFLRN